MAKGAITLKDGLVEQPNLDGYTPSYIVDVPILVDVHIMPSTEAPTGRGEPPVPGIAPAVVNALSKLTSNDIAVCRSSICDLQERSAAPAPRSEN